MKDEANLTDARVSEFLSDFIDPERRKAGEGGFFVQRFREYRCERIFDSCLGDGSDAIDLVRKGFSVVGNDLDPNFRRMARDNLEAAGFDVKMSMTGETCRKN